MRPDVSLEHLLDRVTLVRGSGSRRHGQLCIMSLTALLAGERHTDAPNTASIFIRRFAIAINDSLPQQERQCLKLFAPRMIGTNDNFDGDRARLLLSILTSEVVPALRAEDADYWRKMGNELLNAVAVSEELINTTLRRAREGIIGRNFVEVADCASNLLITYANAARTDAIRARCWSRAIDILDRLCSVGNEIRATSLTPQRVVAAHRTLSKSNLLQQMDLRLEKFAASIAGGLGTAVTPMFRLVAKTSLSANSAAQATMTSRISHQPRHQRSSSKSIDVAV